MPTEIDPDLLKRIRALLEKRSDRGCTEEEAESAANVLEAIMLRHGLDEQALRLAAEESAREEGSVVINLILLAPASPEDRRWQLMLAAACAELLLCRSVTATKPDDSVSVGFVGHPPDTVAAMELFRWLREQAELRADHCWNQRNPVEHTSVSTFGVLYVPTMMGSYGMPQPSKDHFKRSFLLGYAAAVTERVRSRAGKRIEQSDVKDLVRSRSDDIDQFLREQVELVEPDPQARIAVDPQAFYSGNSDGRSSPLEISKELAG